MKNEICCICQKNPVVKTKSSSSLSCHNCKAIHQNRIEMNKIDQNYTIKHPLNYVEIENKNK